MSMSQTLKFHVCNSFILLFVTHALMFCSCYLGCLGTVISTTLFALLLLISIAISIMMTIIYAKRVYEDTNPVSATQSLKRSTAAITTNENVAYVMTLPSERPN